MSRRLELWIAEVSNRLLNLEEGEIRDAVRGALRELARLAESDRAYLMLEPASGEPVEICWCGPGLECPTPQDLADPHSVSSRERGVRSELRLPLPTVDRASGLLVFERVRAPGRWSRSEVDLLRLAGGVLSGVLRTQLSEDALRESEARFRALADHATELVAELGPDGCYLYASPSFKDLLGYDPADVIGRRALWLIHPEDVAQSEAAFREAYDRNAYARAVHRVRHADGSWRWFDATGRAFRTASGELRFVAIGRDITERVAMQDALSVQLEFERRLGDLARRLLASGTSELDDLLREGLESAGKQAEADYAYMWAIDERSPRLWERFEWLAPHVDPRAVEMAAPRERDFPWSADRIGRSELIHIPDPRFLPSEAEPERRELERRGVKSMLGITSHSGAATAAYVGFERLGESRAWSEREIRQLRVFADLFVTAIRRKRDEAALRDSQAQLLQAQKMDAVGQLAGGIAHDFNNLLMVILGNAQALLAELDADSRTCEDAKEILGAAERAASLTRQLLTFSRRQLLEPRAVDLNRVVTQAGEMLGRLLVERIELAIECDFGVPCVWGDSALLEQILVNLALNAQDAMPEGGLLRITTSSARIDSEEAGRLGLPNAGRYVVLSVEDSGSGMDEQTRSRIFEPFFTTKQTDKGTGLGLAIVYGVVHRSGGAVRVESAPGVGSTFHVYLPEAPKMEGEAELEPPRMRRAGGSETLLVVEDEAAVRRIVCQTLRRAGYCVQEARNGEEALAMATGGESIDLLVTDVVMPRMGGIALARQLVAARPELRVLFISGYPQAREDADPLPAEHGFLAKPFAERALLAKVREVLDRDLERPAAKAER